VTEISYFCRRFETTRRNHATSWRKKKTVTGIKQPFSPANDGNIFGDPIAVTPRA
jgi:hypothetical protein